MKSHCMNIGVGLMFLCMKWCFLMFLNGLAASEPDAKTEQGDSQAAFSKHHDALHESFSPCHSWKPTTQQIFSFMIYPEYTLYTPSCSIGGVGIIFHHCKVDLWSQVGFFAL